LDVAGGARNILRAVGIGDARLVIYCGWVGHTIGAFGFKEQRQNTVGLFEKPGEGCEKQVTLVFQAHLDWLMMIRGEQGGGGQIPLGTSPVNTFLASTSYYKP
jgi:hypothetical protein